MEKAAFRLEMAAFGPAVRFDLEVVFQAELDLTRAL